MFISSQTFTQPSAFEHVPVEAQPMAGASATGYGVAGIIETVPDVQPLASDGIWRVTLRGERFGRMVRQNLGTEITSWDLLQIDDMTDEQIDTYEEAMSGRPAL